MLDCTIKVYTEQGYDSHKDCGEEVFRGTLCKKNNHVFVIYKEQDQESKLEITNQIKVSKDGTVSVRRRGHTQSVLHFTEGTPYTTFYNTGHGAMELIFIPTVVRYEDQAHTYKIELRYAIHMGEEKLSDNVYILEARPLA